MVNFQHSIFKISSGISYVLPPPLQHPQAPPISMAEVETTRRSLPRQTKKAENQKEEEENKELFQNLSQIFRWENYIPGSSKGCWMDDKGCL